MNEKNSFKEIALAVSIISGFLFLVFFTSIFIRERYSVQEMCGCSITIPSLMILMSILGIFVGTFVYYILRKNFSDKVNNFNNKVDKTLNFFEGSEKEIVKLLINEGGSISQSRIKKITNLSPVKISRKISKLESKKIINKEKNGMTNKISLKEDYFDIFLSN